MTVAELEKQVNQVLDTCDGKLYPYVCEWRSTTEGRAEVVGFVVQLISDTGESIQAALNKLERAYNPNLLND